MIKRKPKEKQKEYLQAAELLDNFTPATELGKKLLELARQENQKGISRLNADEIRAELGRQKYDSDVC